jgi:hypothetical protein
MPTLERTKKCSLEEVETMGLVGPTKMEGRAPSGYWYHVVLYTIFIFFLIHMYAYTFYTMLFYIYFFSNTYVCTYTLFFEEKSKRSATQLSRKKEVYVQQHRWIYGLYMWQQRAKGTSWQPKCPRHQNLCSYGNHLTKRFDLVCKGTLGNVLAVPRTAR